MAETATPFKSGFVSLVGRPNVGKSTLLNTLVGEKVAIISPKPQTTRNQIIGIHNGKHHQVVFVDTPGIHKPRTRLGEYMDKSVQDALQAIDAMVVIADASREDPQERETIRTLAQKQVPKFLVLNKIDLPAADPERVAREIADLIGGDPDDILKVLKSIPNPDAHLQAFLDLFMHDQVRRIRNAISHGTFNAEFQEVEYRDREKVGQISFPELDHLNSCVFAFWASLWATSLAPEDHA